MIAISAGKIPLVTIMYKYVAVRCNVLKMDTSTADPTWGDIFECCFKAQSSEVERLFSLKRGKRDVRTLSFEFSKMTPQVGLAVLTPVAGSIFGPLSQTHISKRVFMNDISSSALLDIQLTLFYVCAVDSFLPELEHL